MTGAVATPDEPGDRHEQLQRDARDVRATLVRLLESLRADGIVAS